ncbi:MAG: SCO family protein [Motiliproteus sp.]
MKVRIILGSVMLSASSLLWAHDGSTHEEPKSQKLVATAAAHADAPVSIDARPHKDDERARNYFTDLPLLTTDGKPLRFYSDVLRNRVVLINFVYTHCEEGCPVITQQLIQVKKKLGPRFGQEIFFVSISTDPERDSPQAMGEFARKLGAEDPGWLFLTGEKQHIDKIITRLGQYSPVPEQHSSLLLAGNVTTRHWMKLRPNAPLPAITFKLNDLADESTAQSQ